MKTSEGITRARCAMKTNFNSFLKFKIFGHPMWFWGSLVPQSGIKPRPMAVKASSSILWTAREIPKTNLLFWGFTILRESESASHLVCPALCNPRLLFPWDSLGKNTWVGSHSLLQEIFPTQGSNPGLPHCRQTLYHLSHHPVNINPQCSRFGERMSVSWEKTRSRTSEGRLAKEGFPKRSSMASFQSDLSPKYT